MPRAATVCMVVHGYYPFDNRVRRAATAARSAGLDVTVLCLRGPGEKRREQAGGIDIRRLPVSHGHGGRLGKILVEYLGFCALVAGWLAMRSLRRPFSLVHFHNPPDFLVVCGLIPKLRGSKLILDIHDLSAHMFRARVAGLVGRAGGVVLGWLELLACAAVDDILTVHEPYRRELQRHGVAGAKVKVVMNGVESSLINATKTMRAPRSRSNRFQVVYHGTLTHWYGADLIVDAIVELGRLGIDAEALILGDGDAQPLIRKKAKRAGLEDRVLLSGTWTPLEEALALVAAADCGVIPNRPCEINRFALSGKLLEYVALGVPVVVARLETLNLHFGDEEVTFFEPGDARSLASALAWVHGSRQQALKKARLAQERAEAYSWSRGREALLAVYRDLLELDGDDVAGEIAGFDAAREGHERARVRSHSAT